MLGVVSECSRFLEVVEVTYALLLSEMVEEVLFVRGWGEQEHGQRDCVCVCVSEGGREVDATCYIVVRELCPPLDRVRESSFAWWVAAVIEH